MSKTAPKKKTTTEIQIKNFVNACEWAESEGFEKDRAENNQWHNQMMVAHGAIRQCSPIFQKQRSLFLSQKQQNNTGTATIALLMHREGDEVLSEPTF